MLKDAALACVAEEVHNIGFDLRNIRQQYFCSHSREFFDLRVAEQWRLTMQVNL